MNRVTEAVELFLEGHACSQAILSVYGPLFGLERETAIRLSSGFAAGMRMGEVCGAVTGAFMVLGLQHCGADGGKPEGRQACYGAVCSFAAQFKERNASVLCKDLLGCNLGTPEGMESAQSQNLFRTICPKMVQDAAEILEQMLPNASSETPASA